MSYAEIAERVVNLWNGCFAVERPFLEQFKRYGIDYPIAVDQQRKGAQGRGVVEPDTEFVECLANARIYAAPHLMQFAEALDHESAAALRGHLTADHEVLVVDVGCAAGILSLFADRAGFAHYIGVDTNRWMRLLSRAVFESVMNDIAVKTDRPTFKILEHIDSQDGWCDDVRRVSANTDLSAPGARRLTVLLVMNHLVFQRHDVARTVSSAIETCRGLAALPGVHPYLVSIEPGTLYKPDRLGTRGLDGMLLERQLRVERYSVTGVKMLVTGNNKGDAAVRLVSFSA